MDLYKSLVGGLETIVEPVAEPNPVVVEIAVEEAPKPKKPRAPRKKKVEEAPAEVTEAPVEKPKRTRKKKVEETPAEGAEAPAKPKRTRAKKTEEPKAE
jgi:ribonuclease E